MTLETAASVVLAGGSLDYLLRRSPRSRRMRITIDARRGLIVSVPPDTRRGWRRPERAIEAFLGEREAWIRRHLARAATQRARVAAANGLDDGATLRFRGEPHRLRIVAAASERRSSVTREGGEGVDEIVVRVGRSDRRAVDAVVRAWLVERAGGAIAREIERHAGPLGVAPGMIALRDPQSRWGSASREGRLMFSWRLVLAPPEALETVVVHELAHLRVFGHGPAFWDVVASRRPDHREWRRWLRQHSVELHAALAR